MPVAYRIHQSAEAGASVFALSGVLDTEHVARLEELLATTVGRIVLDLKDITLVDRAAVRFLTEMQMAGAEIINCPEYVRSWIVAESDSR
jgi:anti-anti-sigma regulatory factor